VTTIVGSNDNDLLSRHLRWALLIVGHSRVNSSIASLRMPK
jgi:hypothetical protein